jgi:hypothetical protein
MYFGLRRGPSNVVTISVTFDSEEEAQEGKQEWDL